MATMFRLVALWILAIGSQVFAAETITVIGYNTESGGADPDAVAEVIEEIDGCDIWGFSEVNDTSWRDIFEEAVQVDEAADFQAVLGTTGGTDRLLVVFDADRFERLDHFELHRINPLERVRAPLVVHFRIRTTGQEFLFMVNHLYRGRAHFRHLQARLLNQWARQQALPIIAVGDYNFDWEVGDGSGDEDHPHDLGFDLLTEDGVFTWVRPEDLFPTQDSTHQSVLDFVFTAGDTWRWKAESDIIVRAGDFPDDGQTSDHRPIRAVIEIP